mmetsp:Transcript_19137/g.31315  ORF Transcript_19137/g.31315 Transcript_19137/m.31315 type:complete len:1096 (+) Transcript_19137:98-3385(+)|eukprot:CAMPEP_0184669944 /NCGR_PEP_ID=MMETSP0308-20130426/79778_1 /TAXON_ID=38269 /ORGANISM="Gloeochaete witrockiana, Strain SAG 46.84" /LENGTH=1095 /DNA_ID=CAMNT_0027116439 /DNA_START=86 /DNA_END=3373 /DNA_ORIENTATION=-
MGGVTKVSYRTSLILRSDDSQRRISVRSLSDLLHLDGATLLRGATGTFLRFVEGDLETKFTEVFCKATLERGRIFNALGLCVFPLVAINLSFFVSSWTVFLPIILCFLIYAIFLPLTFTRFVKTHVRWTAPTFTLLLSLCGQIANVLVRMMQKDMGVDWAGPVLCFCAFIGLRVKFAIATWAGVGFPLTVFVASACYLSIVRALVITTPVIIALGICLWSGYWLEWYTRRNFYLQSLLEQTQQQVAAQKLKSDRILSNILPHQIVDAYRAKGKASTRRYQNCTVIFIKVVSLPPTTPKHFSSEQQGEEIGMGMGMRGMPTAMRETNRIVFRLEELCEKHSIEQVKTIGTTLMMCSGAPRETSKHLANAALFALDAMRAADDLGHMLQIGMHCGPVVGGVVGAKFFWDIWGDVVNQASRLCTLSLPGCIQVSTEISQVLSDHAVIYFRPCEKPVFVKGKGAVTTFFLHEHELQCNVADTDHADNDDDGSHAEPDPLGWSSEETLAGGKVIGVRGLGLVSSPKAEAGLGLEDTTTYNGNNSQGEGRASRYRYQKLALNLGVDISPLKMHNGDLSGEMFSSHSPAAVATPTMGQQMHAVAETPLGTGPRSGPRKRSVRRGSTTVVEFIGNFRRQFRFNLRFRKTEHETQFWERKYASVAGPTRQCLAFVLLQTAVWAAMEMYLEVINLSHNIILRYVAIPTVTVVFIGVTYHKVFQTAYSRWLTLAYLAVLVFLMSANMFTSCPPFSICNCPNSTRSFLAYDAFFLIMFISLFPSGRLVDVMGLEWLQVFVALGTCVPYGLISVASTQSMCSFLAGWFAESESRREFQLERQQFEQADALTREIANTKNLLCCCMPESFVGLLADKGSGSDSAAALRFYDEVMVLATDIEGFTAWSSKVDAETVVAMLDKLVSAFDNMVDHHGVEKIKTIGDAYLCCVGLTGLDKEHVMGIANLALEARELSRTFVAPDGSRLRLRIGLAIGQAAAGIIGRRKWFWDLWGEAVLLAQKMEATGVTDRVHVTSEVRDRLEQYGYTFGEQCDIERDDPNAVSEVSVSCSQAVRMPSSVGNDGNANRTYFLTGRKNPLHRVQTLPSGYTVN